MPLKTMPWDVIDHLGSDSAIAAYLDACLEDGDPKLVGAALGDIARAKGVTDLAARTGLPDAVLGRALSGEEVPDFATIVKVIAALGLQLGARLAPAATAA